MDEGRLERLLASLHRTDTATPTLRRICRVGVDVASVDWAGLTRIADGRHQPLAASDDDAERIEALQASSADGPCREAVSTLRPSMEPDLATESARNRWPEFASTAVELGVRSALAIPLVSGGVAVGALDLYTREPGELAPVRVGDALMVADLAALAVDHVSGAAPSAIQGVSARAEPAEPWVYPSVVHHATGMVSVQLGIDVDEALLRLRAIAFAMARTVVEVAEDVVARTLRIDPWSRRG